MTDPNTLDIAALDADLTRGRHTLRDLLIPGGALHDALRAAPELHGALELPGGGRLHHRSRMEAEFLVRQIWEERSYGDLELGEGAFVVDVGGNIGAFARWIADRTPNVVLHAIEPIDELASVLEANLAEVSGAQVHRVAAGARRARAELTFFPDYSLVSGQSLALSEGPALRVWRELLVSAARAQECARTPLGLVMRHGADEDVASALDVVLSRWLRLERREVEVVPLSELFTQWSPERIDLLKVDVELAEVEVLEGIGERWWPRIERIVLEAHDVGGRTQALVESLHARGFQVATSAASPPVFLVEALLGEPLPVPELELTGETRLQTVRAWRTR